MQSDFPPLRKFLMGATFSYHLVFYTSCKGGCSRKKRATGRWCRVDCRGGGYFGTRMCVRDVLQAPNLIAHYKLCQCMHALQLQHVQEFTPILFQSFFLRADECKLFLKFVNEVCYIRTRQHPLSQSERSHLVPANITVISCLLH